MTSGMESVPLSPIDIFSKRNLTNLENFGRKQLSNLMQSPYYEGVGDAETFFHACHELFASTCSGASYTGTKASREGFFGTFINSHFPSLNESNELKRNLICEILNLGSLYDLKQPANQWLPFRVGSAALYAPYLVALRQEGCLQENFELCFVGAQSRSEIWQMGRVVDKLSHGARLNVFARQSVVQTFPELYENHDFQSSLASLEEFDDFDPDGQKVILAKHALKERAQYGLISTILNNEEGISIIIDSSNEIDNFLKEAGRILENKRFAVVGFKDISGYYPFVRENSAFRTAVYFYSWLLKSPTMAIPRQQIAFGSEMSHILTTRHSGQIDMLEIHNVRSAVFNYGW